MRLTKAIPIYTPSLLPGFTYEIEKRQYKDEIKGRPGQWAINQKKRNN
ncbi:MAG: hypothetical protein ABI707_11230 [Ferruginibacter sp.]